MQSPASARYVSTFEYNPQHNSDIPCKEGEAFYLLERTDDWCYVQSETSGSKGYLPSHLIQLDLTNEPWFHGNIGRIEAENLLQYSEPGTFLIRESETIKGSYTLTMIQIKDGTKQISHFRINYEDGKYFITSARRFLGLQQLIQHYMQNSDGLACKLVYPQPKPAMEYMELDVWEIERGRLKLETKLGSGGFGDVWKGTLDGSFTVAIKQLQIGTMTTEAFLEEAKAMKQLQHDKLVKLHAVVPTEPVYIVSEFMCNGDLLNYLKRKGSYELQLGDLLDMAAQVASGMAFIEANNYIHRDLRAANILVGENKECKIADFGLARFIPTDEYVAHAGAKLPIRWTAPEALTHRKFTIKSDVWSYGVVLFEIITQGESPYRGIETRGVMKLLDSGYRIPKPVACPDHVYGVMMRCWEKEPKQRPNFNYLNGYFEGVVAGLDMPGDSTF
ncbi:proto-oncogene tyrosine-protein kinase Yrk-like [Ciona intestinalis]